jgi:hypothetical protein
MFKKTENPAAHEMRSVIHFWEFHHPPYSPHLTPSDFHLFLHLKPFLAGRRFHDDEVKEAVTTCFASQAAPFCDGKKKKVKVTL